MRNLKKQAFYPKLTKDFKSKMPDLVAQSKVVFIFDRLEFAAYAFAGGLLLLNIKEIIFGNLNLSEFIMILMGGVAIIAAQYASKEPKKELKKSCEKIKNKLILKICACSDNCTCKDEFVKYMKKRDINILG